MTRRLEYDIGFVIVALGLMIAFWRYENYKLINRVDSAFENGQSVYAEYITSRHCIGLRYEFYSLKHDAEFKIYDQNGNLHNEKLFSTIMGSCRRRRPYRVEWTKLD